MAEISDEAPETPKTSAAEASARALDAGTKADRVLERLDNFAVRTENQVDTIAAKVSDIGASVSRLNNALGDMGASIVVRDVQNQKRIDSLEKTLAQMTALIIDGNARTQRVLDAVEEIRASGGA